MKIQIINGPNLNLLGKREKEIYGEVSFEKYLKILREHFKEYTIDYFQSNIEGEIIDKIHATGFSYDGILLNAGGYTHTSVAIGDAVAAVKTPVIEVHISNIFAREEFRKNTLIASRCMGTISGFGLDSYRLAIESLRVLEK
ncbi:MAG: type II 3-dehydroquinate dehydratase [Bacteroidales bacterium]|jgi:3-dehydroquinate dehydratase-2|nr:type II 3-dehydroquinate dehydratase [Bacteroidales bacterium]